MRARVAWWRARVDGFERAYLVEALGYELDATDGPAVAVLSARVRGVDAAHWEALAGATWTDGAAEWRVVSASASFEVGPVAVCRFRRVSNVALPLTLGPAAAAGGDDGMETVAVLGDGTAGSALSAADARAVLPAPRTAGHQWAGLRVSAATYYGAADLIGWGVWTAGRAGEGGFPAASLVRTHFGGGWTWETRLSTDDPAPTAYPLAFALTAWNLGFALVYNPVTRALSWERWYLPPATQQQADALAGVPSLGVLLVTGYSDAG